jgi:squalene-hopene/tetraprenyl-beta-curcumene cyclase
MKKAFFRQTCGLPIILSLACALTTAAQRTTQPAPLVTSNISVRNEVRHAIERGCAWLESQQKPGHYWSSPDHPALTALVLTALIGPSPQTTTSPAIEKGYDYLVSCAKPDGGIYGKEVQSYNTSVVLSALVLRNRPQDKIVIQNARKYLIGLQVGDAQVASTNSAFVGGIGYGGTNRLPDLSNTTLALEAIYDSRSFTQDTSGVKLPDLNWAAAIRFVQNCQNSAADDPQDKGGFIYRPDRSNAGQTNLPSGRVAFRSCGSMTYAGLLCYAYADLKADDPRVTSALDWLRGNYTVDENPGMGPQGIYYYYQMMAKALTFANVDTLEMKDGHKANWREDLALKLINLQQADGSWANDNGRWWEKDPILDSADAIVALEILENKL